MAGNVKNLNVDDTGEKISWGKVREVTAIHDDPSALHIKTSYEGQSQRLDLNRRKRLSGGAGDASEIQIKMGMPKPGIQELKKRDLVSLCETGQIPNGYRTFYESLPIGGEAEDSAGED